VRGWKCSSRSAGTGRDGLSIWVLADRHGVHRRTARQALASAVSPPRKPYVARSKPSLDPWIEVIDGWLSEDREIPTKQRHPRRVWQRLIAEHGAAVSESTVSRYVVRRRLRWVYRRRMSRSRRPLTRCRG